MIYFYMKTYAKNILYPSGYNICLKVLHGIDVITPGASTVAWFKTGYLKLARFQNVSNKASSKRL